MTNKKLELINEQTSPLFRIMMGYDVSEPKKAFENNICAFHIGNGYVLSVAHNINSEAQLLRSIPEEIYQSEILPQLNPQLVPLFNEYYQLDILKGKRFIKQTHNPLDLQYNTSIQTIIQAFRQINFDSRWFNLLQRKICKPYLIIQFKNNQFYNDIALTSTFSTNNYFHEPILNRHTFLIELELVCTNYKNDIAAYKMVNVSEEIINKIPCIQVSFDVLDDNETNLYCLQSSPTGEVGRLLNNAKIEGYIDNHTIIPDRFGGLTILEGDRYLIKGYFRFGSSGAPYVFYDRESKKFKVNAIQSEACPIQLAIGNNREGNAQYINANATPLKNIQTELERLMNV